MYIPTQTIATVLSTATATSPTSVTSVSVTPGPGVGSSGSLPDIIDSIAKIFTATPDWPRVIPTEIPYPFRPAIPDQDYYRIGEDPLTGCIRQAIKDAGKERFVTLTSNGELESFLIKSRDEGMVGVDTNQDGNDVSGLIDWVRTLAEDDNPNLDPETNDTKTCDQLVWRFSNEQLIDEIIVSWAWRRGIIRDLPPTRPPPEKSPNTTAPGNSTAPSSLAPFANSTRLGNSAVPYNTTHFEGSRLIPDNLTGVKLRLSPGTVGPGIGPVLRNSILPDNVTFPGSLTFSRKKKLARDRIYHVHPFFPGNSTSRGNATVRRDLNSGLYDPSATSHASSPELTLENSKEVLAQVSRDISLEAPEIRELFGNSTDVISTFFAQPDITDRLYEAIKKVKMGESGVILVDYKPLVEFLKKFIKKVTSNSFLGP